MLTLYHWISHINKCWLTLSFSYCFHIWNDLISPPCVCAALMTFVNSAFSPEIFWYLANCSLSVWLCRSCNILLFQGFSCSNRSLSLPLFSTLPPAFFSLSSRCFLSVLLLLCCPVSCMLSWTLQKILAGMVTFSHCLFISMFLLVLTPPTHCGLLGAVSVCVGVWVDVYACIPTSLTTALCMCCVIECLEMVVLLETGTKQKLYWVWSV